MFFYYFCPIQSLLKKCTFRFDFWHISFCRLYIAGTYEEAWDKFFIDKRTGHRTAIDSYPYLSPNGKYIITLGETEMGGPTAIALYKILSKDPFKMELVTVAGIHYWIAYEEDKNRPTFFGKDGCLYVAMDLSGSYQYDKPDKPCKYIRIKIK